MNQSPDLFGAIDANFDGTITREEFENFESGVKENGSNVVQEIVQQEGDRKRGTKTNSRHALRENSAAAKAGYHGIRLPEGPRNRRLYGQAPCMRSSVDEVVFNRDMDQSGGDAEISAEMEHLIGSFEGGAGSKDAMSDLMGVPPADQRPRCVRMYGVEGGVGKSSVDEVVYGRDLDWSGQDEEDIEWHTYAGLRGHEPANPIFPTQPKEADRNIITPNHNLHNSKKIYPGRGKFHSKVSDVVFGKEPPKVTEEELAVQAEHYHNAAGYSHNHSRHPDLLQREQSGRRIYTNAPMNVSQMDRVIHNSPSHQKEGERERHLLQQFEGAAGVSARFSREPHGGVGVRNPITHAVSIYR